MTADRELLQQALDALETVTALTSKKARDGMPKLISALRTRLAQETGEERALESAVRAAVDRFGVKRFVQMLAAQPEPEQEPVAWAMLRAEIEVLRDRLQIMHLENEGLRSELKRLRLAWSAACTYIDASVGDPDATAYALSTWQTFKEIRDNLETVDRQSLQSKGLHPSPCARFCEARAFEIEARNDRRLALRAIADDAFAATFQSMGQYRSALYKVVAECGGKFGLVSIDAAR